MDDRAAQSDAWRHLPDGCEASSFRWLVAGELIGVPVPTRALELDALLRHLEIDGDFSDWTSARAHLAQAHVVWDRLEATLATRLERRGHLKDAVGATREMGGLLVILGEAVRGCAGEDVAWLARRAIHLVEAIERALE